MSYLAEFCVRMKRRSNYPVLIYMFLNTYIIGEVLGFLFSMPFWTAYIAGLLLYVISLMMALSPLGEWFLRREAGCKKIQRKEYIDRVEPLFLSVYEKARERDSAIPADVQLYMNNDPAPNAFATGRKTVCVTKGLFNLDDGQIKGILGHEFGHLAHKDTDQILLICVGNVIIDIIVLIINIIFMMLKIILIITNLFFFFVIAVISRVLPKCLKFDVLFKQLLYALPANALLMIWAKVGLWLTMKTSRNNEFEADEFSFAMGYGNELCSGLDAIEAVKSSRNSSAKGFFASLAESHPDIDARIARLQKLGCNYINNKLKAADKGLEETKKEVKSNQGLSCLQPPQMQVNHVSETDELSTMQNTSYYRVDTSLRSICNESAGAGDILINIFGVMVVFLIAFRFIGSIFGSSGTNLWQQPSGITQTQIENTGNKSVADLGVNSASVSKQINSNASLNRAIDGVYHSSADREGNYVHSAKLTIDGNPGSCWSEGVTGLGVGENIEIHFNGDYKVKGMTIWIGHQKSQDLFYQNARPTALRVVGSDGSSEIYNLEDKFGSQRVAFKIPITTNKVKLIVERVAPGSKYENTCISEVSFF